VTKFINPLSANVVQLTKPSGLRTVNPGCRAPWHGPRGRSHLKLTLLVREQVFLHN